MQILGQGLKDALEPQNQACSQKFAMERAILGVWG